MLTGATSRTGVRRNKKIEKRLNLDLQNHVPINPKESHEPSRAGFCLILLK